MFPEVEREKWPFLADSGPESVFFPKNRCLKGGDN
jgi:hypothetical protein